MSQEVIRKDASLFERMRASLQSLGWHGPALATILALSAFLNLYGLAGEGYANLYYSAAVKNMLTSPYNFFFVSFDTGFVSVDKVSRTSARGVYAAGDCTGVFMLASVAAMQGRIAMWHSLGDAVAPLNLKAVSSNVFTAPEIATVGLTQRSVDAGEVEAETVMLPLATNARAKMQGVRDGFVKLFCQPASGTLIGGVVVAPRASELIHVIALGVAQRLTADQLAQAFTVYPSMSGSVAEAARRLHHVR